MAGNNSKCAQQQMSNVSIDRLEHFSTSKQEDSGGDVVRSIIGPLRQLRSRTPKHPLRRKIFCSGWQGVIATKQHITWICLRHPQLGRVFLGFYDDGSTKPLGWIYVRLNATAFDYCGHSAPISDHTIRARREVQLILQSLHHCLATTGIDVTSDIPFTIPIHHPALTDARLRRSSNGSLELVPYFPLIDCLGVRNISTPIDLRFPCEDWYALYNKVHDKSRRRRTQRRELMKHDNDLAAALMMQSTDFAECIGLGYASGRGSNSRAVCRRHPNGTTSVSIGPHGNQQASYTVSARSTNVYDKSACVDENPRRNASRHHRTYMDINQRKYDMVIRHDGQLGRVLLKKKGWRSLEALLDITLGELAKETLFPLSTRCRSVKKIRLAIAEPKSKGGRQIRDDQASSFLHMLKLVQRYYQALGRACGVEPSGHNLPRIQALREWCNHERISVARLSRYVDSCFQDLAQWMGSSHAVELQACH